MISGAGLCWQHVGGVGSTTTTTTIRRKVQSSVKKKGQCPLEERVCDCWKKGSVTIIGMSKIPLNERVGDH